MPRIVIALAIYLPMLLEAQRAARNERAQRARGGIEPSDDVYKMMRVAYPAAFLAMLGEGAVRGGVPATALVAGATLFVLAKALKWWAILTLGPFWTFRVIVVPGAPLVASGPYRWLRHPNYVGVVGELAGAALMTGALVAGPIATAGFVALLSKRISVESRMLESASRGT
jgi:methyltransferase